MRPDRYAPALLLLLLLLAAPGCSKGPAVPLPDIFAPYPDRPLPDRPSWPGAARDCSPLSDGEGRPGWRVAEVAGVPLHDVACAEGHVFVAGNKATLLHRPPEGSLCRSFLKQKVPTGADLLTVAFAGLSYGATAGRDPTIWETRDAGNTWSVAPQCGDVRFSAFRSFHLHSPTRGCGAGAASPEQGAAYKVYAGKTWICPSQTFPNRELFGAFQREDRGWVVGSHGLILHSPDHWGNLYALDTGSTQTLRSVFFTSNMIGIAVGDEGVIFRSQEGQGMDWSAVKTLGQDSLHDVFFWDQSRGWAVGENGTVLHTSDGGQSWTYQSTPVSELLTAVCFTSASQGWAVGAAGTILVTTTGGG
jgi:photosystem II stability/assembly factor-like uncharacterized protein